MWDPGFPHVQCSPALIHGYHRALCIFSHRWRGTPAQPGLVLGLDRGGACRGVVYRVKAIDVPVTIEALWEREMRRRIYKPRLLHARLPGREVAALAFVADPAHPGYAGRLDTVETAARVANCCGTRGPNIEYLARTMAHLAQLGVRDAQLTRVLDAARELARGRD
jgi:cation transport protein ChaC